MRIEGWISTAVIGLFAFSFICALIYLLIISTSSNTNSVSENQDVVKSKFEVVKGKIIITLIVVYIIITFQFMCATTYKDNPVYTKYELVKATNDKSLKGEGGRWKFNINSNNEFNFYYKDNLGRINYDTIDFNFPIYEDQEKQAYLVETRYEVLKTTKLLWMFDVSYEPQDTTIEKYTSEFELHIPPGQFQDSEVVLD